MSLRYPEHLSVAVAPELSQTESSGGADSRPDEQALLRQALANPLGSQTLSQLAERGAAKPVIVINDITRPTPSDRALPLLLEQLRPLSPTILVSSGNHRRHRADELRQLVGGLDLTIVDHDSAAANLVALGETRRGTPIVVSPHYLDSDLRIVVGQVAFHPFAGYSGGAKSVIPGLAGDATIAHNHGMWPDAGATIGRLAGNPVREDLEEATERCVPTFEVNLVLDLDRRIIAVTSGEMTASYRTAIELHDRWYRPALDRVGDAVVVSAGGYPKDIDFRQSSKALEFAARVVSPGGPILLLADCGDGIGAQVMERLWFGASSAQQLADELRASPSVRGAQRVYPTAELCSKHEVSLYSTLPDQVARRLFVTPIDDPQQWLDRRAAEGQRVVFLGSGGILPRLGNPAKSPKPSNERDSS